MTGRMFSLLEEVVVVTDLQASLLASSEEFSPVCFTAITEKFFFFFYVELFQVEGTCDPMKNSLVYCVYFDIFESLENSIERFWNTKALVPDHFNHTIIITNIMGGLHLGDNADCEALLEN